MRQSKTAVGAVPLVMLHIWESASVSCRIGSYVSSKVAEQWFGNDFINLFSSISTFCRDSCLFFWSAFLFCLISFFFVFVLYQKTSTDLSVFQFAVGCVCARASEILFQQHLQPLCGLAADSKFPFVPEASATTDQRDDSPAALSAAP